MTSEELAHFQEIGIEFADDFSLEEAENGEIKRIYLLGDKCIFKGFNKIKNVYYLKLDSL